MADILTPEQLIVLAEQVKTLLASNSQGVGEITVVASLDNIRSLPALEITGSDEKVVEAPLTLLRVSLRRGANAIEWRHGDNGNWQSLISIPDISGVDGLTPTFRTGPTGIEWKYTNQTDADWTLLVAYDVLKLKFSDLTPTEIQTLWNSVPAAMITVFQKPATDKATELEHWKVTTQQALNKVKDDTVTATENAKKETVKTQKATEDAIKAKNDTNKAIENAELATDSAERSSENADKKATEASAATDEAQKATDKAEAAANRSNALSDHRDEIRAGYWWRWNEVTGEWYNTGEIAKGNIMYATFDYDPITGELSMYTDEEYTGPQFDLDNNGFLSVIL